MKHRIDLKKELLKELPTKARPNQRLLDADGQPCPYCTSTMDRGNPKLQPTADHILPRSRFKLARKEQGRTIIVCSNCNFMKGTLTLSEFISYLIKKNEELLQSVNNNIARIRSIRYLLDMGLERSNNEN